MYLDGRMDTRVKKAALVALGAFLMASAIAFDKTALGYLPDPALDAAIGAFNEMRLAVAEERERLGLDYDAGHDRLRAALVGYASGGLTSTRGEREVKLAVSSPAAVALCLRLFRDAGIGRGTKVAINASGSFPGLVLAAAAACEALGAEARVSLSIGSSSWGANIDGFSIVDIAAAAFGSAGGGLGPAGPIAGPILVTPGGSDDAGVDLQGDAMGAAVERARSLGWSAAEPAGLEEAVRVRLAHFRFPHNSDVLVSIGGNYASAGAVPELGLLSGLIPPGRALPGVGLIQAYAAEAKPVIQLLNLRGLFAEYGLDLALAARGAYEEPSSLKLRRPHWQRLVLAVPAFLAFMASAMLPKAGLIKPL